MKQELKDAYWRRLVAGEHFSPFVMDGLKKAGVVPKPGSNTSATTPSGREPPKGEAISNYEDLLKQGLTAEQARILEEFRDEGLREMGPGNRPSRDSETLRAQLSRWPGR